MNKIVHVSNPLPDSSFIKNNLGKAWKPDGSKTPYLSDILKDMDNEKTSTITITKPVASGMSQTTPDPIFSNSLDSEKAPILFITARLDAIEAMANDGISTVEDTLWLIQELRKRNEEAIRVENWVMGMRGKLEGCLERVEK